MFIRVFHEVKMLHVTECRRKHCGCLGTLVVRHRMLNLHNSSLWLGSVTYVYADLRIIEDPTRGEVTF